MGERWANTGQMPQRMKEEVQENAKHCAVCGDPKHKTREHDKIKRAEQVLRGVEQSKPVAPFRKRARVVVFARTQKGKYGSPPIEKPVLTNRARRLAQKAFPAKPHDWRFHNFTEVKH